MAAAEASFARTAMRAVAAFGRGRTIVAPEEALRVSAKRAENAFLATVALDRLSVPCDGDLSTEQFAKPGFEFGRCHR
jgi:hypothetical protein